MNIQARSHRYLSSRGSILSTSRDIFLRHGFVDASMDTIAQRSGVSKTTLYAHFENKEALFNQVVVDVVIEHADDTEALLDVPAEYSFRDRMAAISLRMLTMLMHPEAMALMRLCVIEGARMPRLSYEALATARSNLRAALTGFFREQAEPNQLAIADPNEAADLFVTLSLRSFQLEAMLPFAQAQTQDALRCNAEQVADLMLRLYGGKTA